MSHVPHDNDPRFDPSEASDESIQEVHAKLLNERPEPVEGFSPMPLFILGFVSTMIFFGAVYFVRNVHSRKGFDPMIYDERFNPETAQTGAGVAKADPIVLGKKAYATCLQCHQANGQGVAGAFPPLAGSEWVVGSEERVIRVLLHGLGGPIQVRGATFNGAMPAFSGPGYNFNDEKIAAVLTYIRQEWGNSAAPITTEKVTEVRTKTADRKAVWTQAELEAIP